MYDISNKNSISDYSKSDFSEFLEEIFSAEGGEAYQDKLVNHFAEIVPNPEGMDLIFWVPDDEANAETIIKKIETWCKDNDRKAFSDSDL